MAVANPGAQLQKPTANQQINNAMNQPAPVTQNDLNTLLGNAVSGVKQTSAKLFNNQAKQTAQTSQEATGNAYDVGANGQAPAGLKAGDTVNTKNGQATVASVNPDGTYQMKPTGDTVSPDVRNLMDQAVSGVKQAAKTVVTNHEQALAQQAQQAQKQPATATASGVYFVGSDGNAPKGLKVGDQVVTAQGTYEITGVNADGSYQNKLVNRNQTTANYTGAYANHTGGVYRVGANNSAPAGLKVGDQVVTGGGTYTITGFKSDGSYASILSNPNQTTANYKGTYANAPAAQNQQQTSAQTQQKQNNLVPTYNKNIDYGDEAIKASNNGDRLAAAALELLRNMKIDGEGKSPSMKTEQFKDLWSQVTPDMLMRLANGYVAGATKTRTNPVPGILDQVNSWRTSSEDWINQIADYNTQKAIDALQRAQEDAQPEFQRQLNLNDINAARAMSNSALYAEARGDRGGIGQSQYNEIQAAAMKNRQTIESARQKLATDTARAIIDAQREGDFEKAKMLKDLGDQHMEKYTSWLMTGAEWDLKLDEIEREIESDNFNRAIQIANITGEYNGQPTWSAQKYEQESALDLVNSLLSLGITPSPELLKAAGYDQYSADVARLAGAAALGFSGGGSSGGGGSSRGGGSGGNGGDGDDEELYPANTTGQALSSFASFQANMDRAAAKSTGRETLKAYENPAKPYSELPFTTAYANKQNSGSQSSSGSSNNSSKSGNSGSTVTYADVRNTVNGMIQNGSTLAAINAKINDAYHQGWITKAQADALKADAKNRRGTK